MLPGCKKMLLSGLLAFIVFCSYCNADKKGDAVDLTEYRIVLPASPIPAEKTASQELQTYLTQITGVTIPVVSCKDFDSGKMIAVGFNSKLPENLSQKHLEQTGGHFQPEEILIASDGSTLVLAGGRPRGTIYAVYEYLHRLGVRWYSPEYTKVPKLKKINFKEDSYRYSPPVFSRSQSSGNLSTQQWCARNRLNSFIVWLPLKEEFGGGVGQGPDMHTLHRMVKKPVLINNPNWLALVNGERQKPVNMHWGVCLSNPHLRNYVINQTIAWAKKHPDRQCIWFGQNDGSKPCECKECKAFYDKHGGEPSSLIVQITNELADRVKREFPGQNKIVKTLAYSFSLNPPKNMKLRDNVILMFCAWAEYDSMVRNNPNKRTKRIRKAIEDWRGIAQRLEVYLYSPPQCYWEARPALLPMCDNIKWAHESGVKNIYVQISGFGGTKGSDLVDLRSWLYARLCWDPSQDTNKLIKDFCDGFYGPAADTVYNAIMEIHSGVLDENHLPRKLNNCSNIPNSIDLKKLRKINARFQNAYNSIKDPTYKKHLSYAWLSFLWSDFWAGYEEAGRYDDASKTWKVPMEDGKLRNHYAKLIKSFMASNKVNAVGELKRMDHRSLAIDLMGIPLPAQKIENGPVSAVVVPHISGRIEDFVDERTGFKPFKPYWGFLMLQYPLYGSTRELVNTGWVRSYGFVKRDDKSVVLHGWMCKHYVQKEVAFDGHRLSIEVRVKPPTSGKLTITPAAMLDLQDKGFGTYPTVHVERKGGTWTQFTLGKESDFWYQYGKIDIANTTGRVVIAAEKSKQGLLLEFDPKCIKSMAYEYDRYAHYAKGARMVWISPTSEQQGKAGEFHSAKVGWTILSDYTELLK